MAKFEMEWAWLAPFQLSFYYGHNNVSDYLAPLKKWLPFAPDDATSYHDLLETGFEKGLLRQIPGDFALLQIQPFWSAQIKHLTAANMSAEFLKKSHMAFVQYYTDLAHSLYAMQNGSDGEQRTAALTILNAEWANLQWTMRNLAVNGEDDTIISSLLRYYFQEPKIRSKLPVKGCCSVLHTWVWAN